MVRMLLAKYTPPFHLTQQKTLGALFSEQRVTPFDFGAIADGNPHPLSERYASLALAQADYPFVTSLVQQIDYCASRAAANECFGSELVILAAFRVVSDSSPANIVIDTTRNWTVNEHVGKTAFRKYMSNGYTESQVIASNTSDTLTLVADFPTGDTVHQENGNQYAIGYGEHGSSATINKPLRFRRGSYWFGDDTLLLRNVGSGIIEGDGKLASIIRGNSTLLAFDGIWYSELGSFSLQLQANDALAAMEIDGNVPGHPYDTRGVQSVTCLNLLIDAGGSDYALTMCRQGENGAQGSECTFINCHFSNAAEACYLQSGFNSLANTFIGGNFQNYPKHGILVTGGTIGVINTGFQSTNGYTQVENDGWDIRIGDAGAYEGVIIYGCRSESMRFIHSSIGVTADVRSCVGRNAIGGWETGLSYGPDTVRGLAVIETTADGAIRCFVVQGAAGVSGALEPAWPTDGSAIVDNTLTWQEVVIDWAVVEAGSIHRPTCYMSGGPGRIQTPSLERVAAKTASYQMSEDDDAVFMDCTAGARTVTLPVLASQSLARGRAVEITKTDLTANALTIAPGTETINGAGSSITISGGASGTRRLRFGNRGAETPPTWVLVGSL